MLDDVLASASSWLDKHDNSGESFDIADCIRAVSLLLLLLRLRVVTPLATLSLLLVILELTGLAMRRVAFFLNRPPTVGVTRFDV